MPKHVTHSLQHATASIDLDALRANAKLAQSLAPHSQLLCMVKADAYGHGMLKVTGALSDWVDAYGVARLQEAVALRESGCQQKIVIFSHHFHDDDFATAKQYGLTPALFAQHNINDQIAACEAAELRYWLKFDTGMHRLGLEALPNNLSLAATHSLCEAVITHLHSADNDALDATNKQLAVFHKMISSDLDHHECRQFSITNSAGLLRHKTAAARANWLQHQLGDYAHNREIIRPGIMLYGADPLQSSNSISQQLQPVMTLKAPIIDIRHVQQGATIGYAGAWTAPRDSTIATIAIGYGDGYPRHATNGTPVLINGKLADLAGRVSMDMIGVDVTTLIANDVTVHVGDQATLWGRGLPVETIARHAMTISYQLLTGVSPRVARVYSE